MDPHLSIGLERGPVKRKRASTPPEARLDDTALFTRFFAGDDAALIELFDRHTQRLGRYCRKMTGDARHVEDLLQDLWERVVRLRDGERGVPPNPLGLLYWMARNLCLNFNRDRRNHLPLDYLAEREHPNISDRELSQLEELVVMALEQLPLEQREVLILSAYSGYTFDEIAQMMEESPGAIRTRAWRARRQLKRIIAALVELEQNNQNDEPLNRENEE